MPRYWHGAHKCLYFVHSTKYFGTPTQSPTHLNVHVNEGAKLSLCPPAHRRVATMGVRGRRWEDREGWVGTVPPNGNEHTCSHKAGVTHQAMIIQHEVGWEGGEKHKQDAIMFA